MYKKVLCGTNIIYKKMEQSRQLVIPNEIKNFQNICLLGVGLQKQGIDKEVSDYTKTMFNYMLDKYAIHSVRDEQTKKMFEEIGIKNVLNTSCPTMWKLTNDHCKKIPTQKGKYVLTTVTDYEKDEENDRFMLETLRNLYEKVYIWIQGQFDYYYLKSIININDYEFIPPSLEELDKLLENDELDYIGTRLHAGIRSLNKLHRSLIISIDNRARDIGKDTNLPIMERDVLKDNLANWINTPHAVDIKLPQENIDKWKNQFKNDLK